MHPKFQKFYEHLTANPDTLPVNGPKLASLLAAEAKTSAAIKDHTPSLLATWQETVRLAAAGNDYKTALPALESLQKHSSGMLGAAPARKAKAKILAAVAEANAAKPTPGEREVLAELVRSLLKELIVANDDDALPLLLAADNKLSWSAAESVNSIQLLLPLAEQAANSNQTNLAKLVFDHLDGLILKTAAGKSRKDFADALVTARERLTIAESAHQAQQTLATKPLDPIANQAYGNYLLTCGRVRESLTYLALGSDPEKKKLAAQSIEVKTAGEKVTLADRWLVTDAASGKQLARLLFEEALADEAFVGIPRAAVEEKLKSLGPAPLPRLSIDDPTKKALPLNEWVDLIPLVDFDKDVARGFWKKGPQNTIVIADKTELPKLRLPVLLANCSYDLIVEFKLAEANKDIYLILPVADRWVQLRVDCFDNNESCVFEGISSGPQVRRNLLHSNHSYRYEVNVRIQLDQAQINFLLNGEKIIEYKGPVANIERRESLIGTTSQPGLATFLDQALFSKCQVRSVEGKASIGRDAPLVKPIPASVLALKPTRLTGLRPLSANAHNNLLGVSSFPKGFRGHIPTIGGSDCTDFLFAHAPSKLTYAIPAKAKYFTAIAYGACNAQVKFIVKADNRVLFTSERKPLDTVCVELPADAKVLELECDELGEIFADHSSWCYAAFR